MIDAIMYVLAAYSRRGICCPVVEKLWDQSSLLGKLFKYDTST